MKSLCLSNPNHLQKDFVMLTVPWTDSSIPLMAPAALKPVIEKAGLSCLAVDLNVEIYEFTKEHQLKDDLIRFFFDEYVTEDTLPILEKMYMAIAEQIVSWQPKYVGLSLFSYVCQHSAKWIAYFVKKLDPSIKIIAGGPGCLPTFTGHSEYVDLMLKQKLFDYHIRGDGELSLYELLVGNEKYDGINSTSWKEMNQEELRSLPAPDYENYIFEKYEKKALPLIGSRGCVRQCKFCDYIANWKKFQYRTADDIFNEMVSQYQKYKITKFKFQDSLTNGNQKEFYKLITLIADYNARHLDNRFTWSGYYIFREPTSRSAEEWEILAQSGAENLAVGIENLNEHIRYAIGKKFSNQAITFHLAQAKKHKIFLLILNIVGYVNEVEKDIDFAKQWLHDNIEYKDNMIIQWGGTLGIFPNTYLSEHKDEIGIKMIGPQPSLWINESIGSTPSVRARWAKELNELGKSLGYNIADSLDNHFLLETLING
jgi:radical SAM superfamily enzyme YgiQ (UPF0313 family)